MNASSTSEAHAGLSPKLTGLPLRLVQSFCLLIAAGLIAAGGASLSAAWSEAKTNDAAASWPTAAGRVVEAKVEPLSIRVGNQPTARSDVHFVVVLEYRYATPTGEYPGIADAPRQAEVASRKEQAEAIAAQYRARPAVEVYWDPLHPSDSRLEREPFSPALLVLMAGMGGVTLLGGAGLVYCGVTVLPKAIA